MEVRFREAASGQVMFTISGPDASSILNRLIGDRPGDYEEVLAGHLVLESATPEEIAPITMHVSREAFQKELIAGVVRVLLNHENRLRTLESKAPVTLEQFRVAVRAVVRG